MSTPLPTRILVAEDEAHLGAILRQFLEANGHAVTVVTDGEQAFAALRAESFDVAILDIVMPHMDGLEVLRHVREEPAPPEVVMITGNGTVDTAITAMRLGAFDYLTKPYRMAEIDLVIRRACEKRTLARENVALRTRLRTVDPLPELVTYHPPLRATMTMLERVAPSSTPVLITGESGTGKEIVARAIHRFSGREPAPLVDIACAALSGSALEGELFGHEAGAYAGAAEQRQGLLEVAGHGSVLLDEIAALDPRLQGALLRVIEQGAFLRVGGSRKVLMGARIISATNKDLDALVASGAFRDDLLYRINTVHVALPPLRERRCDIPALAQHFLERIAGPGHRRLTDEAIGALERYDWPGNVRELRNVVERALLLATGDEITVRDLTIPVHGVERRSPRSPEGRLVPLEEVERDHIRYVLDRCNWHQGRAAEILGISSKTLYRKIREFGFDRASGAPPHLQNTA